MKKVVIVIPAHNEEDRIGRCLEDYTRFFGSLKKDMVIDYEIIVVLNGCVDNTRGVVEGFQIDNNEVVILDFMESGKGFAVVEGFKEALNRGSDFIGFVDADNATPSNAFYGLVRNIKDFDGIIADRWDERSLVGKRNFYLRLRSGVFNFVVRTLFLFNYRDTQCGAKLFTREFIDRIYKKLGNSEWGFDVDLLFYARYFGFKIKSIPTEWHDKTGSKVGKFTPGRMFFSVFRLRLVHSPFSFILRFHKKLPRKMQVSYLFRKR